MLKWIAVAAVALLAVVPAASARTGGKDTIKIVSVGVSHDVATVKVAVSGLKLSPALIGKAAKQGLGHWHIYIDGKYSNASGALVGKSQKLKPGDHKLYVELVNNDHSSLKPRIVSKTITIHA